MAEPSRAESAAPDALATAEPQAARVISQALSHTLAGLLATPLPPGLYLVATPIGHLADISVRALAVLAGADLVWCEDSRHSLKLLQHYGIKRSLRAYHEHSGEAERPRILAALREGRSVALISDAGTPLISDPGFKLVREASRAGHAVVSIPGPSAPIAALACSGLPTDCFLFAGFLPVKPGPRRSRLQDLAAVPATLVLLEAPQRLAESLTDMAELLGPRDGVIARELTKLHEEVRRGTLSELAAWAAGGPIKGEIVVLVGPAKAREVSDEEITDRLREALPAARLKDAAKAIAAELGVPRSRVYDLGLALKSEEPQ